ncbi:hypothetical protein BJX64DRAFT_284554 [Aspergillus heterothallicus]
MEVEERVIAESEEEAMIIKPASGIRHDSVQCVLNRVDFDDEVSGVDIPAALQDPDKYNLIYGRDMLPHLMVRLDTRRTCRYDKRPAAN